MGWDGTKSVSGANLDGERIHGCLLPNLSDVRPSDILQPEKQGIYQGQATPVNEHTQTRKELLRANIVPKGRNLGAGKARPQLQLLTGGQARGRSDRGGKCTSD